MKFLVIIAILLLASSCKGDCQEFQTVSAGDTCDSLIANNPNSLSSDEFMALNPNIDCNNLQDGDQVCLFGDLPQSDSPGSSDQEPSVSSDAQISSDPEQSDPLEESDQEPSSDGDTGNSSDQEPSNPSEQSDQGQPTSDGDVGVQNSSDQEQSSPPEQTEDQQNSSDNESSSEAPSEASQSQSAEETTTSEQEPSPSEDEPTSPDEVPYEAFIQEVLAIHQYYRDFVGSPPLVWNFTLNASAYSWVQHDMAINDFSHSIALGAFDKYGENIAVGSGYYYDSTGRHSESFNATQLYHFLIDPEWEKFVNGSRTFDNSCSTTGNWGDVAHYTQVIWATSTSVGCGITTSGDTTAMVCQYYPPGNRVNEAIY